MSYLELYLSKKKNTKGTKNTKLHEESFSGVVARWMA